MWQEWRPIRLWVEGRRRERRAKGGTPKARKAREGEQREGPCGGPPVRELCEREPKDRKAGRGGERNRGKDQGDGVRGIAWEQSLQGSARTCISRRREQEKGEGSLGQGAGSCGITD